MGRDAETVGEALEPVFSGGMALLAEARLRLADDCVTTGLDEAARTALSVLLLDLSTALMLLRAVAECDMAAEPACEEAERLDLPGQVTRALTPALRSARAPALQVVLLQVSALAAQVLELLDGLAFLDTLACGDVAGPEQGPWGDLAPPDLAAEKEKPRRHPEGRPRLRLVTSQGLSEEEHP